MPAGTGRETPGSPHAAQPANGDHERLSGGLTDSYNEGLAPFSNTVGNQPLSQRNIEENSQFGARLEHGLASLRWIEGSLTHRELVCSAVEYSSHAFRQNAASLGMNYRPGGLLRLGAAWRTTRGAHPRVGSIDAGFESENIERNDIDLTTTWMPSGLSTVNGRLNVARQKYLSAGSETRDFSGVTGSLKWDYRPTGKLTFSTWLSRDTGIETSFLNDGLCTGTSDNSQVTTALALAANDEATAKIRADAAVRLYRRSLEDRVSNPAAAPSGQSGSDRSTGLSLGATWAPTRNGLLGCSLGRDSRNASSSAVAAGLSCGYSADTASCSARFVLQ